MLLLKKEITFVIPYYNSMKTIDLTVNSILEQYTDNYKIIIVNDGSNNTNSDFLQKYDYYNHIKIFNKPNGGVSSARNLGLAHVDTEFVVFLDADDFINPEYTNDIKKKNGDMSSEVLVYSYRVFDGKKNTDVKNKTIKKDFAFNYLLGKLKLQTACFVLSTKFIKKHNLSFNETISWGEDILFFSQVLSLSKKTHHSNLYMVNYNTSSDIDRLSNFSFDQFENDIIYNHLLLNTSTIYQEKKLVEIISNYRLPAQLINRLLEFVAADYERELIYEKYSSFVHIIDSSITNKAGLRKVKLIINRIKLKNTIKKWKL